MRILSPLKGSTFAFSLFLLSLHITAQETNTKVTQDAKFEQLLDKKRNINNTNNINNSYRIQIFSGKSDHARNTLSEFKKDFNKLDTAIIFNTPNYKVLVGNFESRIDAERNLIDIRQKYPNAFLIRPSH